MTLFLFPGELFAEGINLCSASVYEEFVKEARVIMLNQEKGLFQKIFKVRKLQKQKFPKKCSLSGVDFTGRDLENAYFKKSNLINTNFTGAKLAKANFKGAQIMGANFTEADLRGADFEGAKYNSATKFPKGFDIAAAKMILVLDKSPSKSSL